MLIESVVIIGSTSVLAIVTPYVVGGIFGGGAIAGGAGGVAGITSLIFYLKRKKQNEQDGKIDNELETLAQNEEQSLTNLIENTKNTQFELHENLSETSQRIQEGSGEIINNTEALKKATTEAQSTYAICRELFKKADKNLRPKISLVLTTIEKTGVLNTQLNTTIQQLEKDQEGLRQTIDRLTETNSRLELNLSQTTELLSEQNARLNRIRNQTPDSATTIHLLTTKLSELFKQNQALKAQLSTSVIPHSEDNSLSFSQDKKSNNKR